MVDVFREVRERVSAEDAARRYGIEFDQHRKAKCPFHNDKHPSMTFKNGRFRCWSCNTFGDCIDFTGRLLGLEPIEAIERLNTDFSLELPLHRKPTLEDTQRAQKRKELARVYKSFEAWRNGLIRQLNAAYREGHFALKNCKGLEHLTEWEVQAIREQARFEYLADVLTTGDIMEQMQIFRERGRVGELCNKVLNNSPMKSDVA